MLKKFLNCSLLIPFFLIFSSTTSFAKEEIRPEVRSIKTLLNKKTINFEDIKSLIIKYNLELLSLKELVESSSFNLSSKISKRYPTLDLNANGLPQYLYSKSFNNKSSDTKTSQYQINPSLNLRWDIIDPQRGLEIKSAKDSFEIARNNYEIKKKDLIQEAKSRFHKLQKSAQDAKNSQIAVDLSKTSVRDAKAKLEVGIGTKFELLEANSQLARDQQILKEKIIAKEINLILLKEIFNINLDDEFIIDEQQRLSGFWFYTLEKNIKNGLKNSFSLKNITLQNSIKKNQAQSFNNANLPVIFLSNNLSSSFSKGSSLTTEVDPDKSSSTYTNKISLNFTWNIFNGGRYDNSSKAKISEAKSEQLKYLNLQNIIKSNISEAFLTLGKNKEKVISTKQEILSSEEALRLARLRYDVGISTLKDVLVRQKELTRAKSKNIDAIYNYNISLDKLERLTFLSKSKDCNAQNNAKEDLISSICDY